LPTGSESGIYEDLRDVEADLRNQYRLIWVFAPVIAPLLLMVLWLIRVRLMPW
jgi:hypothetical protein